jgi:O-antigen/teichoic acid export membrane protein
MRIPFARHLFAIADQGLYSVSNFALQILLARWLPEESYGAFATTYAVFHLLTLVHTAVLTEPMLVFGSRRYRDRISGYHVVLIRFHAVVSLLLTALLLGVFQYLRSIGEGGLAEGALGIAIASGFILLFYIYRKICYVVNRVGSAAISGGVYLVVMLAGAFALNAGGRLTILSAYLLMGVGALIATLILHLLLGIGAKVPEQARPGMMEAFNEHWAYGRWAFGTAVLIWIPSKVYYLVLPYSGGLEANAAFRALMNLVMPITQANMALATVMLPSLARIQDRTLFERQLRTMTLAVTGGTVAYWMLIGLFGGTLIDLAYGGRYVEQAHYLWVMGGVPVVSWLALAERSALKAIERPDLVFWANVGSAALALSVGVYLTFEYEVIGAVSAMLMAYSVMFVVLRLQRGALLTSPMRAP